MYVTKLFQDARELVIYLNTNTIAQSKIVSIYFDGASGKHTLVYAT